MGLGRARCWASVLLVTGLTACATMPVEKGPLPQVAARAEGKIKSAFEPQLAVARGLASELEAQCAMPSANQPLQPTLEKALKTNRDFFGLSIVLEPKGIAACGREVLQPDPGFDGQDVYSAYYFGAEDNIKAQDERHDPQTLAYWYDPLMAAPGTRFLSPFLYPLAGKDTATISLASTLQVGGQAIGVVALDTAYAELIDDLNFPEFKLGHGGVYLVDDSDHWVIAPFFSDIGFPITDRSTGSVGSGLVQAYETYKQSHSGKVWQGRADGFAFRLSPLRLAGQDRVWTLIVALPEQAATAN